MSIQNKYEKSIVLDEEQEKCRALESSLENLHATCKWPQNAPKMSKSYKNVVYHVSI